MPFSDEMMAAFTKEAEIDDLYTKCVYIVGYYDTHRRTCDTWYDKEMPCNCALKDKEK